MYEKNRFIPEALIHTQTYTFVVAPCLKTHRHISRTMAATGFGHSIVKLHKKAGKADQKSRQTIVTQKCLSGSYFLSLVMLGIDAQIEID